MSGRTKTDDPIDARAMTGDPTTARADILSRIRTATVDAAAVEIPRGYRQHGAGAGSPELLDRFAERVADYRADVQRCPAGEVAGTIAGILAGRSRRRVVVPGGFPLEWVHAGVDAIDAIDGATATRSELDGSDGTMSLCAVAIAETGTVVLDAGPGQGPRVLSLVPDYLLVIVRAEQVVELVGDALARLDPLRPLTWISGPSATSDIELNRVEGVHGPRILDVVIVESS